MTTQTKRTLSSQAQVAKRIRQFCKSLGVKCKATSDSFSMGDSVDWKVENVDPVTFEKIKDFADQHQYGHFNGMEDIYEYSNSRKDIPQTKHCHGGNSFTDDYYQAAWDLLRAEYPANAKGKPENYQDAKDWSFFSDERSYHTDSIGHQVYQLLSGARFSNYEELTQKFWAERTTQAQQPKADQSGEMAAGTGAHIEQHTHTKKGFEMFLIVIDERLDREAFNRLRDACNASGGWYSRQWGATPGGFAFRELANAESFLAAHFGQSEQVPQTNTAPKPAAKPKQGTAEKLRSLADKMQSAIDNKLADRLTNTPKRIAQAAHARIDGEQLQRTQQALYRLSELHEAGNVPDVLQGLNSKAAIYELMATRKELTPNGWHQYYRCTGEPAETSPQAVALWALIGTKSEEDKQADQLREKVNALQFANLPGYFPTPAPIVDLMLQYADLQKDDLILEPSAGSGAIIDGIETELREKHGQDVSTAVICYEIQSSLCEVLRLKGQNPIQEDFREAQPKRIGFDKVLMNPPFEMLQDVDHVMHAYQFLKPGGRLVAIMSPAGFYRSDKKAEKFRAWFECVNGEAVPLPSGSFKASGTGVETKLIIIDK